MQAYIADIVKSYVDWAGKDAIVVFFAGCDFRCPFCFTSKILDTKEEFLKDNREVKRSIMRESFECDTVYFTGGEPCLQRPALLDFSKFSKKLGLKSGLQTNGTNPKVIKKLTDEKLIDYISLDLKSPFDSEVFEKTTSSRTFFKQTEDIMSEIKNTLEILKKNENNIRIDIRTTIVPSVMFNKEHVLRIASQLRGINCVWILQQYQPHLGRIASKTLGSVNKPSVKFMENIKEACLNVNPSLDIEIKTDKFNFQ